jgi:hypothetical protein
VRRRLLVRSGGLFLRRRWFVLAAALALSYCGGDDDGPAGPRLPGIQGSWALRGSPDLVVDSCDLNAVVDLEELFDGVIAQTDGPLDFSQDGASFTLHGDEDVSGTVTTSGTFRTAEIVDDEEDVTVRVHVEGTLAGNRMTGRFVLALMDEARTCDVEFAFTADRVSDRPNLSRGVLPGVVRSLKLEIPRLRVVELETPRPRAMELE